MPKRRDNSAETGEAPAATTDENTGGEEIVTEAEIGELETESGDDFEEAAREAFEPIGEAGQRVQDQTHYDVVDLLATTGQREHDMTGSDGLRHIYRFPDHVTRVKVPLEHAIRFAQIPDAFAVFNRMGQPVRARRQVAGDPANGLSPHQVVASLTELTTEALVSRVLKVARTERLRNSAITATREQLIEFLLATPDAPAATGQTADQGAGSGDSLIDAQDDEFAGANV